MKPLIKAKPKQNDKVKTSLNHFTHEQLQFLSQFGRKEVKEMLKELNNKNQLHYIARMYNAHDVFTDLLAIAGPSDVKIISYSITEFPLRILSQLQNKGLIKTLDFILDFTVSRTPALKQFAQHFANRIRFTDIHSKIILIKGKSIKITFISSANFTRNNRFENGIIDTSEELHTQYNKWFEKIFNDAAD